MDICKTVAEDDERRADVQTLPAMPTPPPTSPESEELAGPASPSASSEASTSSSTLNSEDDERLLDAKVPAGQRISIYVQVFEEMLETVLERESYLFNDEEKEMLARFSTMSYEARYLFVRLFSRKNGWFRIVKLGYHDEIANMKRTVDELCGLASVGDKQASEKMSNIKDEDDEMHAGPSTIVIPSSPVISESGIVVIASDTEDEVEDRKGKKRAKDIDPLSNRSIQEIKQDQQSFGLSRFAISEEILASRADIDELLSMLSLDELKILGKDLRVTSSKATRPLLIEAIKRTASSQSTLKSMFAAGQARQEAQRSGRKSRQSMDTRSIVARQTEHVIGKILGQLGHCIKLESGPIRLFARLHLLYYRSVTYSEKSLTQAVLSRFKIRNYPSYAVKRSFAIFADRQALVDYEEALILERRMEEFLGEAADPSKGRSTKKFTKEDREKGFRNGLNLFEEVYPRWQSLVAEAQKHDLENGKLVKDEDGDLQEPPDDRLTYYRKRFLAGWPLTRIVYKGTTILARLHQYDREVEILRSLLGQSCFRRGKRGEWYDRLALVLMNHTGGDKEENRREALAVCEEGLAHPWTHLIYHNSLQRRIVRLESALGVPAEDRHPPVPGLRAAKKRIMKGEKLSEGETGKKSSWRAMDGAEVSVEALSLECYSKEGWKGFHSENGILTTIFALLFWDVIFAPIDGVFETAYQAGPLDLSTDAFAIVRSELVQDRLQAIEAGKAYEMLLEADERERERKTYCVGLRWAYERDDLLEIVQCLSPEALVTICRVYAEEWSHRTGGVPDLFLWNSDEKKARFVEVKGPGDILSETQKVWIDVLLSTNVEVELCSVKQIFEEDDLSLSEDEKARLAPLRRKKRGSEESSTTPQKPSKQRKESVAEESATDDGETPRATVKRSKKASSKAVSVDKVDTKPTRPSRAARTSSLKESTPRRAIKASPSGNTKRKISVASDAVIILSD